MISLEGESRASTHTHTSASDGLYSPEEVVYDVAEAGMKGLVISDHDSMSGVDRAIAEGLKCGIFVIPGQEITTSPGFPPNHILAINIHTPIKSFLGYERTIYEIKKQGGLVGLPHPNRASLGPKKTRECLEKKEIDAIEIISGKVFYSDLGDPYSSPLYNGIALLGSSDSHHAGIDVSCIVTGFYGETAEDLINAIKNAQTRPVPVRPVSVPRWDSVRQGLKAVFEEGPRKYWYNRGEILGYIKLKLGVA